MCPMCMLRRRGLSIGGTVQFVCFGGGLSVDGILIPMRVLWLQTKHSLKEMHGMVSLYSCMHQ